jgi:signal peptidase II
MWCSACRLGLELESGMQSAVEPLQGAAPGSGWEGDRVTKWLLVGVPTLVAVISDQWTKAWITSTYPLHSALPIIDGFFNLVHVRNTGAAFSMLADQPAAFRIPFFVVVSIVAAGFLLQFIRSTPVSDRLTLIAAGGVLGGAVGNFIDRVTQGAVVDFIEVYWRQYYFPAFNVADSFITVGVILLILASFQANSPSSTA